MNSWYRWIGTRNMGLCRGNDQRDRDLRPVQQEVTISSTTNGFDYQISIIHFLPMLKSASTVTFQKEKKKKAGLCFARPLKTYICCSANMRFNLRQTALSIHHSKIKVFFVSLLLEISALFRHQVIVITENNMHLSEPTFIKLSHVPQTQSFYFKNCNFVAVNYLINCFTIFYRNKGIAGTFCL